MDQWIVVTDSDAASAEQMRVCRAVPHALRGAVQCDLPENADAAVCREVERFPAFCHVPSNACVYGVRSTREELEALTALVVGPAAPSSSAAHGPPPGSS
jgi:hypothetical protein